MRELRAGDLVTLAEGDVAVVTGPAPVTPGRHVVKVTRANPRSHRKDGDVCLVDEEDFGTMGGPR